MSKVRADSQVNNATGHFIQSDGSVSMSAAFNLGGNAIQNVGAPSSPNDVATKDYADSIKQGLYPKDAVRVATEVNITDLAAGAPNTVDGVSLAQGNRVLVKSQSTASENGVYAVDTVGTGTNGSWSRAIDFDEDAEVNGGSFVFVSEGTTNADAGFVLATNDPITVGTTGLNFTQFSGAGQITAGSGMTKTGNTLDVVGADASLTVNPDDIAVALDGTANTIQLGGSGLQVADATAGTFLLGQGAGVDTAFVSLTGDVASVDSAGNVTLVSNVVKEADYVVREAFTGDGTTTDFALTNTPVSSKEMVFLNGLLQLAGGTDYSISGSTISFTTAPANGDPIRVTYLTA